MILQATPLYLLLHSPLVGPLTWTPVADRMRERGLNVLVPALRDSDASKNPFWKQHAESIMQAFSDIPQNIPVIFIAHSGAGPLLPAIRQSLPNPVKAYVFVDAGIPLNGETRLDLMRLEDPEWANEFQKDLERGERFPTWTLDDLREVIPDENVRRQLVVELHPRGLDFFTEFIPVFAGWPDAPCIYIQFSTAYEWDMAQARQSGWYIYRLEAGHFHMLVDEKTVTDIIVNAVNNIPA